MRGDSLIRVDRCRSGVSFSLRDEACRHREITLTAQTEADAVAVAAVVQATIRRLQGAQCGLYDVIAQLSGVKRTVERHS